MKKGQPRQLGGHIVIVENIQWVIVSAEFLLGLKLFRTESAPWQGYELILPNLSPYRAHLVAMYVRHLVRFHDDQFGLRIFVPQSYLVCVLPS